MNNTHAIEYNIYNIIYNITTNKSIAYLTVPKKFLYLYKPQKQLDLPVLQENL